MKKKLLLFVAILSVMVFALSVTICGAELVDGIYYSLTNGDEPYATVTSDNRTGCELADVVIPDTITVGGVTYKVTHISSSAFGSTSDSTANNQFIKTLTIGANVQSVGSHAFRNLPYLKSVAINNTQAKTPIEFTNAEFYGNKALVSVTCHKDAKVSAYGDHCFSFCSILETVDYPSTLTYIGDNCFRDNKMLTSGDLSGTKVTTIAYWAYNGCSSLTSVKLPFCLETLGDNAYQATKITSIIIPETLTSTTKDIFNSTPLVYAVIPAKLDGVASTIFSSCKSLKVVFYTGSDAEYAKGKISQISGFTAVDFANYDPSIEFSSYTTNTIFYNAKTCQTCNGLIGEREFVFTSLAEVMKDQALCTNCLGGDITEYSAVFTNLGFSKFEINNSVAQGFVICKDSLALYNERFPEAQVSEYGLLAVVKSRVDSENTAFDSEGNAKAGVASLELSSRGYELIEMRITGLSTDSFLDDGTTSYADLELYINAYVYVGDTIYYMSNGQSATTLTGAITYNSVKK